MLYHPLIITIPIFLLLFTVKMLKKQYVKLTQPPLSLFLHMRQPTLARFQPPRSTQTDLAEITWPHDYQINLLLFRLMS